MVMHRWRPTKGTETNTSHARIGLVLMTATFFLSPFLPVPSPSRHALAADFDAVVKIIEARCISCHDEATREGGIDLTPVLQRRNSADGKHTRLWVKLEGMVVRGEMPPKDEGSLKPSEKETIRQWFRRSFVLRDGQAHIGPTPLRRLTRYELENTLEDVLAIKLKVPYRDTISGQIELSKLQSMVPSDIPGESGFDNDAHRLEELEPPLREIADAVHYAVQLFAKDASARKTVFGQAAISANAREDEIKPILSRILVRAHRGNRKRLDETTSVYFKQYEKHYGVTKDSMQSLLHVLQMILISPEFLYRLEESRNLARPYPVSGPELATRLSYFLWSTTPDEELLQLGQDGSLLKEGVLRAQIARMLNSPKRLALSESFAGQWLGFEELLSNSEYFTNERWNRETYDEALFFFDELIKTNKSILEIVQSDWVYKRASVVDRGKGYTRIDSESVKSVYADVLSSRKSKSQNKRSRYDPPILVEVKNDRDGGMITTPAIMRLTASKSRTSPIRRGVWVLSTIIGKELEPPPNVPSLEEAREALNNIENPSVAEVIRQHVARAECISCHKAIDPLGLGLENYSPTGRWRKRYPDKAPVESMGVMPNGKRFKTPLEMKRLLLELYKDEIAENFVEQMFAYALGRKLKPFDRVSLEAMVRKVKGDGYRINTVIEQIVLSRQFRNRQDR